MLIEVGMACHLLQGPSLERTAPDPHTAAVAGTPPAGHAPNQSAAGLSCQNSWFVPISAWAPADLVTLADCADAVTAVTDDWHRACLQHALQYVGAASVAVQRQREVVPLRRLAQDALPEPSPIVWAVAEHAALAPAQLHVSGTCGQCILSAILASAAAGRSTNNTQVAQR